MRDDVKRMIIMTLVTLFVRFIQNDQLFEHYECHKKSRSGLKYFLHSKTLFSISFGKFTVFKPLKFIAITFLLLPNCTFYSSKLNLFL